MAIVASRFRRTPFYGIAGISTHSRHGITAKLSCVKSLGQLYLEASGCNSLRRKSPKDTGDAMWPFGSALSKQLKELGSTDPRTRSGAIAAIGHLAREGKDASQAIPALLHLAMHDPKAPIRCYALNAINPMLQSDYPHRPRNYRDLALPIAACLTSEHIDAEGINEILLGKTQLEDIRSEAASNLIAIGVDSLTAITVCLEQNPKAAITAHKEIDYVRTLLRNRK